MKETKFKQTEVGMIPSDWEVKTLGSVYRFKYGIFNNNPDNGGPFPVYGANGIIGSYTKYNAENSVVIGHIGTAGTVIWAGGKHFVTYNGTIADIKDKSANDSRYGYFQLLRLDIPSICNGSSQPFLAYDKLNVLNIPLPPTIEEQQRIANALSDVDTLIANLEKLIAKKKNIKQGAMQQLLTGRKRLPGFAPAKPTYKQTELGIIPTDWEVKKIGEFTKLQAGGTPSTLCDEFWGGNIRWMNSGELNNKRIYDVAGRITELGLNSSSTHLIPSNCVLVGLAGQGKTRGTAAINYVELCTNQSIAAMFPSKTHNSEYLYHNIDSRYEELRELSSGDGGRGGLNLGILANLFIALPSKEEQTAIANVLSDMDAEISALETKLAKYRTLKTGMMQQLLTGKIRLVLK